MSIESIASLSGATVPLAPLAARARTDGADFAALLGDGIAQVDQGLKAADQQLRTLAAGGTQAPHDVMISMEEARMNLMMMVEVRNRVVEAYQELIRMQL